MDAEGRAGRWALPTTCTPRWVARLHLALQFSGAMLDLSSATVRVASRHCSYQAWKVQSVGCGHWHRHFCALGSTGALGPEGVVTAVFVSTAMLAKVVPEMASILASRHVIVCFAFNEVCLQLTLTLRICLQPSHQ